MSNAERYLLASGYYPKECVYNMLGIPFTIKWWERLALRFVKVQFGYDFVIGTTNDKPVVAYKVFRGKIYVVDDFEHPTGGKR